LANQLARHRLGPSIFWAESLPVGAFVSKNGSIILILTRDFFISMIEVALFAQVILWLIVLGLFLASGQASIYHPATMYLGFHGLVFVIRPVLVHYLAFDSIWNYIGFWPDEEDFIRTLGVSSVGLISFVGASLFFGRTQVVFKPGPAPSFSSQQYRALIWTTLILLPYMVVSIATTQGGSEASGERAANGVFIQTHSTGYLNDSQFMLGPLLCFWLVVTRFHWLNFPPILMYLGYRIWMGWSRWTIVLFFLMVVFAYCWQQRRYWVPLRFMVIAVPVLMMFNVLGHNRDLLRDFLTGTQSQEINYQRLGMSDEEKRNLRYDTQDFANFDYLCFVVSVYASHPDADTYGLQYLQLLTEPIPRILWKGKPTGAPIPSKIDLHAFGNFVGLTVSLPGDGWISGGWIGVIITMGIAGSIVGLAHRRFWTKSGDPIRQLFYLTFLAISPNWFRDGGISVFKFVLFTWAPLLIWQGMIWWQGGRTVQGYAVQLRSGDHLHLIQPKPGGPPVT
jgi:hypothetical protein